MFGGNRKLRRDEKGSVAVGVLTSICIQLLSELLKDVIEKGSIIQNWRGTRKKYSYQIYEGLRSELYNYLPEEKGYLKRIGFVFGQDQFIKSVQAFEIGIYGFLPFHKLIKKHGNEIIEGETIENHANLLVSRIKDRNVDDDAVKAGKNLLNYLFNNCCNKEFPELLIAPEKTPFTEVYKKLYQENGEKSAQQFLRASFRGLYGSSDRFKRIALSNKSLDVVQRMCKGYASERKIKKNAKKLCKELGVDAVKIMQPKIITDEEEGIIIPTSIMLNKREKETLENLMNIFREELEEFDKKKIGKIQRVPIIIDVYHGLKKGHLASLCAGYNKEEGKIQRIRKWTDVPKKPEDRLKALATKYSVF